MKSPILSTAALCFSTLLLTPFGLAQTPPAPLKTIDIPHAAPIYLPAPQNIEDRAKKPLTAEEAARIALALQPSVASAKAQADAARARFLETRSGLLPSLTLTSGYAYSTRFGSLGAGTGSNVTGGSTSVSAAPSFYNELIARQLLFDFGKTRDSVNQSKALADAALTTFTKVQADLVYTVKSQFYAANSAKQLIDVATANVKSRQDQLDLATASYKAGLGPPADVVTATTSLADATAALVTAENNYLLATITLAAQMGIDPRTPIELAPSDEPSVVVTPSKNDLQNFVTEALKQRPEILIAKSNLDAANYGLSSAKKDQAPSLAVSAGVGTGGAFDPFENDNVTLGISLTFPIYDGGLSPAHIKEASAGLAQSLADYKTATLGVVSDVAQSYTNLQAAEQLVKIDDANVASAQQAVQLAEGRYKAGVTTFIEITTAQATLVTTQGEQVAAHTALQTARAQFVRALGRTIPGVKRYAYGTVSGRTKMATHGPKNN